MKLDNGELILLSLILQACCLSVVAGTIALSPATSAFTIGQLESDQWAANIRGQSFRPDAQGNGGSGTPPDRGRVFLRSFTFAYQSEAERTATVLHIYDTLPLLNDLNNGSGAVLLSSAEFLDSNGIDSRFNFPSRTFIFRSNITLLLSGSYYALFAENQAIRAKAENPYGSGSRYLAESDLTFRPTGVDTAFAAEFVPIPFSFNPLFGLVWLGLLRTIRYLKSSKSSSSLEQIK